MSLFYLTKKNHLEEEIINLFHEASIFTFDFKLCEVTQSDGATSNKSKSLSSIYFIHQEDSCTLLRQSIQTSKQLFITTFITFQPTFTCSKSNKNM